MSFEIFHQLGHNYVWNLQSLKEDHTGSGVIVAPRYMEREKVEDLDADIKRCSVFDPQFFLPDTAKGKLSTYEFFPNVAASDGFETSEYSEKDAHFSAKNCVQFQSENGFRFILIPTRHLTGMPTDFIEKQESLFVSHFLESISSIGKGTEIIIQLVLNDDMIKDEKYSADILNWITGIPDIHGVYLIVENNSQDKQIKDPEFLYRLLHFIHALSYNELKIILGYQSTEALLTTLASPFAVTLGSYENMRKFNIRTFEEREDERMVGPTPRIYASNLLQWIDHRYKDALLRRVGDSIFDKNKYQAVMFQPTFNWHFTKPELYKHYFLVFSDQLEEFVGLSPKDRYHKLVEDIERAKDIYRLIETKGIVLDSDSDGSHLNYWLTSANEFALDQGWR